MVQDAVDEKAPMARIADKAASRLVAVALLIAVIALHGDAANIVSAVTVLVVFCPCDLVLATPTAIMAAIRRQSTVLSRNRVEALEKKMGKNRYYRF